MAVTTIPVMYGPLAQRPAPATVGDGALYAAPDNGNALYQVQGGNWIKIADTGGGGGAGSDTSAVHRDPNVLAGSSTFEAGSTAITGISEVSLLQADWGIVSAAQSPPGGFTAAIDPSVPWVGGALSTGDHTYAISALDHLRNETAPTSPITVTIPSSPTHGVALAWNDQVSDTDAYPSQIKVYRDNDILVALDGTATGWSDDGSQGTNPSFHPASGNMTGGVAADGPLFGKWFQSFLTGGGRISVGSGVPTRPGGVDPAVNDVYVRNDSDGTANTWLYRCSVGGPTPTWVGKL